MSVDKQFVMSFTSQEASDPLQIKKPFISERNRVKRVEWATAHLQLEYQKVEHKFCGVTNHHSFCDTRDECVCGGLKMIIRMTRDYSKELWNMTRKLCCGVVFSWWGTGDLHRVKGIMKAQQYRQILIHHMVSICSSVVWRSKMDICQQHNDPKHTAHVKQRCDCFGLALVKVLIWILLRICGQFLISHLQDRHPSNKDELLEIVQNSWDHIQLKTLRSLIKSMPQRWSALSLTLMDTPTKYWECFILYILSLTKFFSLQLWKL